MPLFVSEHAAYMWLVGPLFAAVTGKDALPPPFLHASAAFGSLDAGAGLPRVLGDSHLGAPAKDTTRLLCARAGVAFKEGFCYNKWEAAGLFGSMPLLMGGHLLGIWPAEVGRGCARNAGCVRVPCVRSWGVPRGGVMAEAGTQANSCAAGHQGPPLWQQSRPLSFSVVMAAHARTASLPSPLPLRCRWSAASWPRPLSSSRSLLHASTPSR